MSGAQRFRHLAPSSSRSGRSPSRMFVVPGASPVEDIFSPPVSQASQSEDPIQSQDRIESQDFSPSKRYRTKEPVAELEVQSPPHILDAAAGVRVPGSLASHLRPYQKQGISFLYERWRDDVGCILGDDMGLGKTFQCISLMTALATSGDQGSKKSCRFLVMAPLTTLEQWAQECKKWTSALRTTLYHGNGREKQVSLANLESGRANVMLTSYETYSLDSDMLSKQEWTAVVLDELHRLKSIKTKLYKSCLKLRCHRRIGLTGTLMQNNLRELYAVVNFVHPGQLGTYQNFDVHFVRPITAGLQSDATPMDLQLSRSASQALSARLEPMFLRRTKEQQLRDFLPKKEDAVLLCAMTKLQIRLYERLLDQPDVQLIKDAANTCGVHMVPRRQCCLASRMSDIQAAMLRALANLRKVANSVHRVLDNKDLSASLLSEQEVADIQQMHLEHSMELSGKMKVLSQLLPKWKVEGAKVLIFSQSTKMLDLLGRFCQHFQYSFSKLDGTTPESRRQALIDDFSTSTTRFIFLISTKTGGTGLNLTAANYAVIFDPDWNTSNDAQAADRIYRIGQTRECHIYRFVSVGTIEENMYLRQVYKHQLGNSAINRAEDTRYFNDSDVFGIQNLLVANTASSRTMEVLGRTDKDYEIVQNPDAAAEDGSHSAVNLGGAHSVLEAIVSKQLAPDNGGRNNDEDDEIELDDAQMSDQLSAHPVGVVHSHRTSDITGNNADERQQRDAAIRSLAAPQLTEAEKLYKENPKLLESKMAWLERRKKKQKQVTSPAMHTPERK